jgi:acetamidase/formamidase
MGNHFHLAVAPDTVHWGYFSKCVEPALRVSSGDVVTIETLTHHAGDDYDRMVKGDAGAEAIYQWDATRMTMRRRGAGPTEGPFVIGPGEGLGVHLMTGPVWMEGAEAGDVLEVRILDVKLRPSRNPEFAGRSFGVNAAAWWGYHYHDLITDPKPREVVTIFEVHCHEHEPWAQAVYNFTWKPQTDPSGVVHPTIDYPGVVVDPGRITRNWKVLQNVRVPARLHFGTMGVAPAEADFVNSIPPSYTGGNIDDWRIGKGATMYYPIAVDGAMFSVGDPHAAQGDSELDGTAIETSLTGDFQLILHKRDRLEGSILEGLGHPLLETAAHWSVYGFTFANYLAELGPNAQTDVASHASIDRAMRDAFRKMRRFLMTAKGLSEDEAIALMSVAVDFGITQVVDGNWGVHATLQKRIFVPPDG